MVLKKPLQPSLKTKSQENFIHDQVPGWVKRKGHQKNRHRMVAKNMEDLVIIEAMDQPNLHPEQTEAEQTHPEAGAEGHFHHHEGGTHPHQVCHLKGTEKLLMKIVVPIPS